MLRHFPQVDSLVACRTSPFHYNGRFLPLFRFPVLFSFFLSFFHIRSLRGSAFSSPSFDKKRKIFRKWEKDSKLVRSVEKWRNLKSEFPQSECTTDDDLCQIDAKGKDRKSRVPTNFPGLFTNGRLEVPVVAAARRYGSRYHGKR